MKNILLGILFFILTSERLSLCYHLIILTYIVKNLGGFKGVRDFFFFLMKKEIIIAPFQI